MFRGIDPEGLVALAETAEQRTDSVNLRATVAIELLSRYGRHADGNSLGAAIGRVKHWGTESRSTLRWRANAIRTGQQAGLDVLSMLRAQFAAEALFSLGDVDTAYQGWLGQVQAGRVRVDAAVADVTAWLNQGFTDWDVSNRDLHNIQTTLAGLVGNELDRVIARLSPAQLERWIAEMGHRINGFSRDEKRNVFALLAARSSGETLGRVHNAIVAVSGQEAAADFGAAIQTHAADSAIVEFIEYTVARNLAGHRFSAIAPALALAGLDSDDAIDTASRIVVGAEDALAALIVDSQLKTDAAENAAAGSAISTLTRTTDVETRSALFAAMTTICANGELIADFVTRRRSLEFGVRDATAAAEARTHAAIVSECLDAATDLIIADPNAVIQELATDLDRDGSLTTTYWGLLTAAGQGGTIASILSQLRGGATVQTDEFGRRGPDPAYTYPHARNLAFTAATLNRAFTVYAEEAKGDIDAITRLAGVIVATAGILSGVGDIGAGLIGISADWELSGVAATTKQGVDEELVILIDVVTERLRPLDSAPPLPDGAADAWTDVYLRLMPFA